jgi:hypothetical protein
VNEQARLLLSAYRPGGSDAKDPAFVEALAQAQRDPQLRAWLEDSQHFDRAISERLRSLDVPPDLRATILAGVRLSRPPRWWQSPRLWAIAATFAIAATATWFWWPRSEKVRGSQNGAFQYPRQEPRIIWYPDLQRTPELELWQVDVLAEIEAVEHGTVRLDLENSDSLPLLDWLRTRGIPNPPTVPTMLAGKKALGCKALKSAGRFVSVICFKLDNEGVVHLFTTSGAGLQFPPPEHHPSFHRHRNWNLANWSNGELVHMLASTIDEEKFRKLVPSDIARQMIHDAMMLAKVLPD